MTFKPFRNASGEICCSDVDALCDSCKTKNAARTHRSASVPSALTAPPDSYHADVLKLRAANLRSEGVIDLPSIRKSSAIHHDANGNVDPFFADVERLRSEYSR